MTDMAGLEQMITYIQIDTYTGSKIRGVKLSNTQTLY